MEDVIETVHDLSLLHVTNYDGSWDGFEPGDPIEGADAAAEKLVTVRALKSTLGVSREDAGPAYIDDDEDISRELEDIRTEVNALDDRRSELEDELRSIDDRLEAAGPLADLGIDLDLLSGYESISTAVGEGDVEQIQDELESAENVEASETFVSDDAVAIFVYPQLAIEEILVGTPFTRYEIPAVESETSPDEYVEDLEHRRQQVESKLETVHRELEEVTIEVAGFLLAVEEKLSIEVQKREAPLVFATTENAFVAEGWIPTERYPDLTDALTETVADHVEIEELERATYDDDGRATEREDVERTGADQHGETVAADGGDITMAESEPPVVQDNPTSIQPFELMVKAVNRPKYSEFDPTFILFLTFPVFFGFMIGDVGYGILYMAIGYVLYQGRIRAIDSPGWQALGGIALWAGGFTILFGLLYGEFFGLHELGEIVWGGHPPMEKGLSPATLEYAQLWLIVSVLAGLVHLTIGYILGFIEDLGHGFVEAVAENGSWLLLMGGIWVWIFAGANGNAPDIMVGAESVLAEFIGFTGFSTTVGLIGLAVAALGFLLLLVGEGGVGAIESLNVLVNVLSYTRIAAVLLAKAGMAFVVNLLVFGAYEDEGGQFHFIANNYDSLSEVHGEVLFPGILTDASGISFVFAVLGAILIFIIGHLLVLALGITSAGLQGVRLEYVEFFSKFYEGGGQPYEPFGHTHHPAADS